jgi:hypothetical protein
MKNLLSLLAIFCVLLLLSPASGHAQVTTSLERLEIVLWPEYDQPGVLVMLRGWLPADAHLPTYVPLPLPSGTVPTAVAKRNTAGRLLNAAHTVVDHGTLQEVRIAADTRDIRLEYYAPLTRAGTTTSYSFEWPAFISLDSIAWEIQQPVGASGMVTNPASDTTRTGFDGLTYFSGDLGSVGVGEGFTIDFRYSKTIPSLTITSLKQQDEPVIFQQPPPSQKEAASDDAGSRGAFSWAVLIPVLLIAVLLVVWFMQSGSDS